MFRRFLTFLRDREWVATVNAAAAAVAVATLELETLADAIDEIGLPDTEIAGLGVVQWGIGFASVWAARRGVNSNATLAAAERAHRDATG